MLFVTDFLRIFAVLIVLVAGPLVLLTVTVVIIGGFVYLVAGPEFRVQMLGWAPGVQHGVKKSLEQAQAFRDRSDGESE